MTLGEKGKYECQGNSDPPLTSMVALSVEDSVAKVSVKHQASNNDDKTNLVKCYFVTINTALNLECLVDRGSVGPDNHYLDTGVLHWLRDGRILDASVDNIQIKTDIGMVVNVSYTFTDYQN